jgi:iron complex outermembrane receptor protein
VPPLRHIICATVLSVLSTTQALAQPAGARSDGAPDADEDFHHHRANSEIVVTAPLARNRFDMLSGTSVLAGAALARDLRTTIGETLSRQPGVSSTSFGPNASRPVLRGLQGERVRVLTDGIGSFDVSNTSVDHAVAINPLTAERIEVLRGPAALLFGSSAIGGVVNVLDRRIPRRVPDGPGHLEAAATYGTAADERSASAAVDVPASDKIVLHLDGSYTKTDDLETGGYILSAPLRAQAAASEDPETAELAGLRGRLPNSAARTWDVAGGVALITDRGNLGVSVSRLDSLYGVPERFAIDAAGHEHDHEGEEHEGEDHDHEGEAGHSHEQVRVDMRQTRLDMRGELDTGGGFLDRIAFRGGYADYRHDELEPTGEVGTTFEADGLEGRLQFEQARRGGWSGAFGAQFFSRDFEVEGEEKFLPRNETQQIGLFALQALERGAIRAEAGVRYERSTLSAAADPDIGNPDLRRTFDAFSGSLGASLRVAPRLRVSLNATHSERGPSAEELFAGGPHAGTQAFEVGDPTLAKERSNGLEAAVRATGDGYSVAVSGYYSWFDRFIYQTPTGEEVGGLPVYMLAQADARLYGFELEASGRLATLGDVALVVDGLADYTRATLEDVGPVPRIPPLRLLGGIEAQAERMQGRLEVEHVFEQDRVAEFETTTGAYTLVNASVSFRPFGDANPTGIIVSANNLFDVTARRHTSFLKDFAPLAGRDIRVSARLDF